MTFIPNTPEDREAMLAEIGVETIGDLFAPVPAAARFDRDLDLGPVLTEPEAMEYLSELATRNKPTSEVSSFLGGGASRHFSPALVRHLLLRSEFFTAYTPYQAEVSQGTLQAIFEFQTMISRLTGMEVANASLYDGASALAEAMLMAFGLMKKKNRVLVSRAVNPRYREVLVSYALGREIEVEEIPLAEDGRTDPARLDERLEDDVAAVILSQPSYLGHLEETTRLAAAARSAGALTVVTVDPLSLAILEPPGSYGADIVTAEGQSLGLPLSFGGPYLGLMATRQAHIRHLPGRLVSLAEDIEGNRGYVLTLQTREQHIRREKATSNICTNQSLLALCATLHLAALGERGFQEVGRSCCANGHYLADRLQDSGLPRIFQQPFFREFAVRASGPAREFLTRLRDARINGGISLEEDYPELGPGAMLVSASEVHGKSEIENYAAEAAKLGGEVSLEQVDL